MANYVDDIELTKMLMKEIEEYKNGERKSPSNELAKEFLKIFDNIMKSSKFSSYTDDYKQDFLSKAQYKFIMYWHKFNPDRVRKNEEGEEVRGAFSYFSLLAYTSITDEIKRNNRWHQMIRKNTEELLKELKIN